MFDIGWSELLVLGAIALIVVGPKDLPGLLRTLGQTAGKARRMAREFQSSMEDAAREADVSELRDVQKSMADWNRRIGGETPKKFAERMAKGPDKPAAGSASSSKAPAAEKAPPRAEAADPAPADAAKSDAAKPDAAPGPRAPADAPPATSRDA